MKKRDFIKRFGALGLIPFSQSIRYTSLNKTENLCSISFKLPEENVSVPGIYYFVFQKLSWDGINVSQIISTSNEFTILVNEEEVDKAFSIINRLKSI